MSKLKIDERFEKAMNAFFEHEPDANRFDLEYVGQRPVAIEVRGQNRLRSLLLRIVVGVLHDSFKNLPIDVCELVYI